MSANNSNSVNTTSTERNIVEIDRPKSPSKVSYYTKKTLHITEIFVIVLIALSLLRVLFCTIKGIPFTIPTFMSLLDRLQTFTAIDLTALQIGTISAVDWGLFSGLAVILNILIEIVNVITLVFMGIVSVLSMIIGLLSWVIGI